MKPFEVPAVLDEFKGEVFEEFRVRGSFALGSEIAGGAHESASEMLIPDAIDDDSCGECLGFVEQCFGELGSSAAIIEWTGGLSGEDGKESAGNDFAWIAGISAAEYGEISGDTIAVVEFGEFIAFGQHEDAGFFEDVSERGIEEGGLLFEVGQLLFDVGGLFGMFLFCLAEPGFEVAGGSARGDD